eukprot:738120-Karenia_brevis.AAC.1
MANGALVSDGVKRLRDLLKSGKIQDSVIDYIVSGQPVGLGCESVSDFASMFKESEYEQALNDE